MEGLGSQLDHYSAVSLFTNPFLVYLIVLVTAELSVGSWFGQRPRWWAADTFISLDMLRDEDDERH